MATTRRRRASNRAAAAACVVAVVVCVVAVVARAADAAGDAVVGASSHSRSTRRSRDAIGDGARERVGRVGRGRGLLQAAPNDAAGYPRARAATTDGFDVEHALDAPGTVYYVVRQSPTTTVLSAANVKGGVDPSGAPVAASGSFSVTSAGVAASATVRGLLENRAYVLSVVSESSGVTPTLQSTVQTQSVMTADGTAPVVSSFTHEARGTEIAMTVALGDEDGTFYYVLQLRGSTAPTVQQVVDGLQNDGTPALAKGSAYLAKGRPQTLVTTGSVALNYGGEYTAYYVTEDRHGNKPAAPTSANVDTAPSPPSSPSPPPPPSPSPPPPAPGVAQPPSPSPPPSPPPTPEVDAPRYVAGSPAITNVQQTSFDLEVELSEAGVAYYAVYDRAAAVAMPSGAVLKTQTSLPSVSFLRAFGSLDVANGSKSTRTIAGFSEGAELVIFIVAEDDLQNMMSSTTVIDINLIDDIAPAATFDAVVQGTSLKIIVNSNEIGEAFYVLDTDTQIQWTTTQILNPPAGTPSPFKSGSINITQAGADVSSTISIGYGYEFNVFVVVVDRYDNYYPVVLKSTSALSTGPAPPPPPPSPPPPPAKRVERDHGTLLTMFVGTYTLLGLLCLYGCYRWLQKCSGTQYRDNLMKRRAFDAKGRQFQGKQYNLAKKSVDGETVSTVRPESDMIKGYADYEEYDVMEAGSKTHVGGMHYKEAHATKNAQQVSREHRLNRLLNLSRRVEKES